MPTQSVLLGSPIYQSIVNCLHGMALPRYSALFLLLDHSVALHDGYTVTGIGPEYPEIFCCLQDAMGDKSDGVIVIDRVHRQAWWAPTPAATTFLSENNPPPPSYFSNKAVPPMTH